MPTQKATDARTPGQLSKARESAGPVQSLHDYRRALRAGFTVAESIELARMMAQSRILGGAS